MSHATLSTHLDSLKDAGGETGQDGRLKAEWRTTENNRRAKYYRLTAAGRRQLEQHRARWNRVSFAVASVLEGA